jgi:hypothetical protein
MSIWIGFSIWLSFLGFLRVGKLVAFLEEHEYQLSAMDEKVLREKQKTESLVICQHSSPPGPDHHIARVCC